MLDAALTPQRRQQGVRRLPALRERARDRRAAARQEDRAALRARPRSCTSSSTATPTARRRSASPTSDVDQARAAGVLIEFERGRPIIVDRPLYRELVKAAIKRTHDELDAKADGGRQGEEDRARRPRQPADPVTVGQARARRAAARAHRPGARRQPRPRPRADPQPRHRRPGDIDVARFFVYALLGADHDSSPYTQTGERIARIAAGGVRLVDRRAAHRRHQDPQGRQPRPAADRLRRPPRPAGRDRVAVEVHRRRQDRRRALRPRAGRHRRRAARHPARRARPASGCPPPAGARTRTSPPRRSRSSPARTSPRR